MQNQNLKVLTCPFVLTSHPNYSPPTICIWFVWPHCSLPCASLPDPRVPGTLSSLTMQERFRRTANKPKPLFISWIQPLLAQRVLFVCLFLFLFLRFSLECFISWLKFQPLFCNPPFAGDEIKWSSHSPETQQACEMTKAGQDTH